MVQLVTHEQPNIRVDREALAVGGNAYPLDDVLYAEVIDAQGQRLEGFLRREDIVLMFWIALLVLLAALCLTVGLSTFAGAVRGDKLPAVSLAFVMWLAGKALLRQMAGAGKRRIQDPLTVLIHFRVGSMEILQTGSLLQGQILAARINTAMQRRMMS